MKIYAFEVRDDEREYFEELSGIPEIELELHPEGLTRTSISKLEPGCGVTVLGMYNYRRPELDMMKDQGVIGLSTRTIGYNHIDIDYARQIGLHVCNACYDPHGVADYTIMMILLCLRNYKQALWRTQVNDFSLTGLMGRELKDLTVGIVGTGQIGALGLDCIEYEEDIVHRDLRTDILSNRDMAYLRQFKNVIHTQHMAFYTDSAVKSMVYCGVRGLVEMAAGKECPTQLC